MLTIHGRGRPVIDGILVLYYRRLFRPIAATVEESYLAFEQFSRFPVWKVNTHLGVPPVLDSLQFRVIVVNWSLMFGEHTLLTDEWKAFLKRATASYKVVFLQDEFEFCQGRFRFLAEHGIDCIYTCFEGEAIDQTYGRYVAIRDRYTYLPGYVSPQLLAAARLAVPDSDRLIDIGYRGRQVQYNAGRGAQEKHEIGVEFARRTAGRGLVVDIATGEGERIYGEEWYRFTARSRITLGSESGTSIVDLEDTIRPAVERYLEHHPNASFAEVETAILAPAEDAIYYRTISPRFFEAAALRVCMILFRGRYSDVLEPWVHYLPLEKDYSNFERILKLALNPAVRRYLTGNAYRDLIASGQYSYEHFIREFDNNLEAAGVHPGRVQNRRWIAWQLTYGLSRRRLVAIQFALRAVDYPGKNRLKTAVRWVRNVLRRP